MSACVEWAKYRDKNGYGQCGHKGKKVFAHRLAYVQAHGLQLEDIDGLQVRHTCDNPPCVNPDHLLLGTNADNMRDKIERGRARSPRGSAVGNAKLTEADIPKIRAMLARGELHKDIAREFGVSMRPIHQIAAGKTWRHV
jgi:hypothetical protein